MYSNHYQNRKYTEKLKMSKEPQFMAGVFPYMVKVDEYVVNIRPLDYENAVMYFTDVNGRQFDVPTETKIQVFEYKNKDSVNQSIMEMDLNVEPGTLYFHLKMENSYSIQYNDHIILEGGKSVNGKLYEIGDLFEYPQSELEKDQEKSSRFTSIMKGSIVKGSTKITISSKTGIDIFKMVLAEGIPEDSWVTSIVYDPLYITINNPATETINNVTLMFTFENQDLYEEEQDANSYFNKYLIRQYSEDELYQ